MKKRSAHAQSRYGWRRVDNCCVKTRPTAEKTRAPDDSASRRDPTQRDLAPVVPIVRDRFAGNMMICVTHPSECCGTSDKRRKLRNEDVCGSNQYSGFG